VRAFVNSNANLGADLRQKILQTLDELETTVAIRSATHGAGPP
jgi:hypothetical protein